MHQVFFKNQTKKLALSVSTCKPQDLERLVNFANFQSSQGQVGPQLLLGALQLPPQTAQTSFCGDRLGLAIWIVCYNWSCRGLPLTWTAATGVFVRCDVMFLDLFSNVWILIVGGSEKNIKVLLKKRKIISLEFKTKSNNRLSNAEKHLLNEAHLQVGDRLEHDEVVLTLYAF